MARCRGRQWHRLWRKTRRANSVNDGHCLSEIDGASLAKGRISSIPLSQSLDGGHIEQTLGLHHGVIALGRIKRLVPVDDLRHPALRHSVANSLAVFLCRMTTAANNPSGAFSDAICSVR